MNNKIETVRKDIGMPFFNFIKILGMSEYMYTEFLNDRVKLSEQQVELIAILSGLPVEYFYDDSPINHIDVYSDENFTTRFNIVLQISRKLFYREVVLT